MKRPKWFYFLCFSQLGVFTWAAEPPQPGYTVESFLADTLQHDPTFKRLLNRKLALTFNEAIELDPADLILEVEGEYGFFQSNDNSAQKGDSSATIALRQLLPQTGTEASVQYSRIASVTTSVTRYKSVLGLQISQDIIRNAFGSGYRLKKNKVTVNTRLAKLQVVEAYEDYVSAMMNLYLAWHRAEERRNTALLNLEEEEQVLKLIRRKKRLGVAYADELSRAQIAVLRAKSELQRFENENRNRRIQLANIAGRDELKLGSSVAINFEETFTGSSSPVNQPSRTFQVLSLLEKSADLDIKIAADDLLPSAKVFAGIDLLSSEYSLSRPDQKLYFGASAELNFTQKQDQATRDVSLINRQDVTYLQDEIKQRLRVEQAIINNHITSSKIILDLALQTEALAEKATRQVQRKYNLGQATITDLAAARRELVMARAERVERTADYAQFKLEKLRLEDQLIRKLPTVNSR